MALLAHARWFVEDAQGFRPQWEFLGEPLTVALLVGGVLTTVLIAALTHGRTPLLPGTAALPHLRPALPRLLAAAAGSSLLLLTAQGSFVVPSLDLTMAGEGVGPAIVQVLVGLWLVSGLALPAAAVALVLLLAAVGMAGGPLLWLEGAYLLGIAILLVAPTGSRDERWAVHALAVLLGVSLIVGAVTEKLAFPAVMLAVLTDHPVLNLPATIGLPLSDLEFVRLLGVGEVTLGLLVATGAARQVVSLLGLGPFVATVAVFGLPEVAGHLPIYGALAALAVHGTPALAAERVTLARQRRRSPTARPSSAAAVGLE